MNRLELEDLAEAELKEAVRLDPKLPEAHYLLGQIAISRSRLDEGLSLPAAGACDQPGPCDVVLSDRRGVHRQAKWTEAIGALQQSIWIDPLFSSPCHPARQGLQPNGSARGSRGHAQAGDRIRPQQQVRALPVRADPASRRGKQKMPAASSRSPSGCREMSSSCHRRPGASGEQEITRSRDHLVFRVEAS